MNLLLIETSSINCSVALSINNTLHAIVEKTEANIHAQAITLFIEQVLAESTLQLNDLDAIAVGKGPGSYTGLRIGVSTAKGLCYALNKPLIACSSLENLFLKAKEFHTDEHAIYCALIDARRMEVYTTSYNYAGAQIKEISAEIMNEASFEHALESNTHIFFGDGAEKLKPFYAKHKNAVFLDQLYPSAASMQSMAVRKFEEKAFEDLAYFEPYYLKEFYFNK
jgi:tRNA threonylcarbamoyladenosine biosynthesis protein TsaB